MTIDDAPNRLTATEAARLIADRRLSSEDLVRACLARIAEREPVIGAWTRLDPEGAIAAARICDSTVPQGPMHGLPFAVKDVIDTADLPTEYGSPIYSGHRPAADSPCVAALRRAGGVLLGKTVTTEFATSFAGKTRNPHDPARTPGGSSSGTAAAVADFMVPFGFGTQTAGSVIRPASYCGVCGFKPTHGALPLQGLWKLVEDFDTIGTMARSFDDVALFHDAACGRTHRVLPDGLGRTPRVALCTGHQWDQAEPSSVAAMERALSRLEDVGAEVGTVTLPAHFAALWDAQVTLACVAFVASFRREYAGHRPLLSDSLRTRIERGLGCPPDRQAAAAALAIRCRSEIHGLFGHWDAFLTPSAPGEAPSGLQDTGSPVFNGVWTLLQSPCVTIPRYRGPGGMPVGVQLVGRRGADAGLLALAKWVHTRL